MTDHPAAIAERDRVVEWLREQANLLRQEGEPYHELSIGAGWYSDAADAIERGDHITQSGGLGEAD